MATVYWLIWGAVAVFGSTAVVALAWAVEAGQMRDLGLAALSIFDEGEPVGMVTDTFPSSPETRSQGHGETAGQAGGQA